MFIRYGYCYMFAILGNLIFADRVAVNHEGMFLNTISVAIVLITLAMIRYTERKTNAL